MFTLKVFSLGVNCPSKEVLFDLFLTILEFALEKIKEGVLDWLPVVPVTTEIFKTYVLSSIECTHPIKEAVVEFKDPVNYILTNMNKINWSNILLAVCRNCFIFFKHLYDERSYLNCWPSSTKKTNFVQTGSKFIGVRCPSLEKEGWRRTLA